jgi:hypothetical protein
MSRAYIDVLCRCCVRLVPVLALALPGALVGCSSETLSDDPEPTEVEGEAEGDVTCDPRLVYYPVRGRHNNGYDSQAGNSSLWTCNADRSNSDFIAGDHLGNDIWAAGGTPVVATVSGRATLVGFSSFSGNKVTIIDSCGWAHFSTHLRSIAPGITNGTFVPAGTVIGSVGNSGTGSNGVIHLHYSIYPAGNYNAGINPWRHLNAVESNVCNLPGANPPPPPPQHGADAEHVVAAANPAGQLEVFWTGAAGAIMHAAQVASGWTAPAALGGAAKELAVGNNADGRIEIFYVGTNDQLFHRVQLPTGDWSREIAFGTAGKDIAVGRNSDGRLELFFTDAGNAIRHVWQLAPNDAWSEPSALGGAAKDLAVGSNADGRLEVFYAGTNDQLFHRVQLATGGWSSEIAFGLAGRDLAVGRNSDGRMELIFTDASDAIQHAWQTAPNSGWSAASALGGRAKRVTVGNNADGRLEVFYVGTNDQLFHRVQLPTGGWSSEIAFGLGATDLAFARNADGRLELFYTSASGAMNHVWQLTANGSWSAGAAL